MDCIIPGPSVRIFSSAIACLSRVGKDLYVDFDPLDGLKLSALNDAKSAFSEFHFEPSFFERCGMQIVVPQSTEHHGTTNGARKRARAQQQSSPSSASSVSPRLQRRGSNRRSDPSTNTDDHEQHDNNDDDGEEDEDNDRFTCRVPFRAMSAVIRSRKNVSSLRLRKEISSSHVYLCFEFRLAAVDGEEDGNVVGRNATASPLLLRVVHRMGVVEDVNTMAAIVSRDNCSEITASPKVLLRMLEPLKQTFQVSFIVHDVDKTITATSFHHQSTSNNAVLQASTAKLIKTETCIGCDELDDFHFRDDRKVEGDNDDDDDEDNNDNEDLPDHVNEQVTLVYSIKEAKAMLTFCSTAYPINNVEQPELKVLMSFHWGGKPVVLETSGDSFSARMVLATLDHKVVGRNGSGNDGGEATRTDHNGRRSISHHE